MDALDAFSNVFLHHFFFFLIKTRSYTLTTSPRWMSPWEGSGYIGMMPAPVSSLSSGKTPWPVQSPGSEQGISQKTGLGQGGFRTQPNSRIRIVIAMLSISAE